MKKLKILPSILMLVLCVGVLAVGVFAITPTTNTISGQITINPSNAPVKIELLKDGTLIRTYDQVRTGITWDVNEFAKDGNTNLLFDTEGKNQVKEVPKIKFTLRVTNLSETEALGMFFENPESKIVANAEGVYPLATAYNVLGDHVLKDKTDGTSPVANVYISKYTPLGPVTTKNGEKVYDTMDMNIVLSMADFYTTSKTADLNYKLIIEKYEATTDYANSNEGLIKIPFKSELTGKAFATDAPSEIFAASFDNRQTIKYLALPNTTTRMSGSSSYDYENYDNYYYNQLEGISLPSSLQGISSGGLMSNKLKSIDFSSCKNFEIIDDMVQPIRSTSLKFLDLSNNGLHSVYGVISDSEDVLISDLDWWANLYNDTDSYSPPSCNLYINGVLLTEIEYGMLENTKAFRGNKGISKVNFEGNETEIYGNSFEGWVELRSIELPETITRIGDHAFSRSSITSITIPKNVVYLGFAAFYECANLKSITIDGCINLDFIDEYCQHFDGTSIEQIKVKKDTTLITAYKLPTTHRPGYTATWNIPTIATNHFEDTIYTCTYVANS